MIGFVLKCLHCSDFIYYCMARYSVTVKFFITSEHCKPYSCILIEVRSELRSITELDKI